jgi:hypothetical protein
MEVEVDVQAAGADGRDHLLTSTSVTAGVSLLEAPAVPRAVPVEASVVAG